MTKIMVASWGWLCLNVVVDWYTKKIVGYYLSCRSKTKDWLQAVEKAVNQQFPEGIMETKKEVRLVSDNGSQPTSIRFMKTCSLLGIKQIFASYNNPKGNADTERVIRTLKEDLVWPNDFQTPFELQKALDKWIKDYNEDYPHSSLNYKTPTEFEELYYKNLHKVCA